jgi:drug/metabolite transporter (DMT)-like permease
MMNETELAVVVFGLASALSWGAGDFSGGLAARRAPVFAVMAVGHGVGLLLLITLALVWGERLPPAASLAWGLAAGLAGVVGLAALYRALAIGRMGLVAPVSAVITAALPVLFGAATEGLPGAWTLAGFGIALVGIWFVAGAGGGASGRAGLGLALLAGCGFGVFFILIDRAGESAVFWPLAATRCGSLAVVLPLVLARRRYEDRRSRIEDRDLRSSVLDPRSSALGLIPDRRLLVPMLLSGTLDAAGNAFFVLATQSGRLDVAAVLASLYPASTVLLAALLLGERVTRAQVVGIGAVLAAIALIAG